MRASKSRSSPLMSRRYSIVCTPTDAGRASAASKRSATSRGSSSPTLRPISSSRGRISDSRPAGRLEVRAVARHPEHQVRDRVEQRPAARLAELQRLEAAVLHHRHPGRRDDLVDERLLVVEGRVVDDRAELDVLVGDLGDRALRRDRGQLAAVALGVDVGADLVDPGQEDAESGRRAPGAARTGSPRASARRAPRGGAAPPRGRAGCAAGRRGRTAGPSRS